jgi:YVTN family beta-propeller protein
VLSLCLGVLRSSGAAAAWAERVYVSNEDGHSVSVIDAARAEVIATIDAEVRRG